MNKDRFIKEVELLGIEVSEKKLKQLDKYYELLIEYNKVMNLTGITEYEDVYLKHFYDSLTIAKVIDLNKEINLCDLGSGAGFPGIVLKIFYPDLEVVLIDSLNKRINFLNIVIQELELSKIQTVSGRIEEYSKKNKEKFDIVTARAVAPLNMLLELGINLVKIDKNFVALKGNIEKEQNFSNAMNKLDCSIDKIIKFRMPIENSNRCLIKILKNKSTSNLFPRKYSEIKKKPL